MKSQKRGYLLKKSSKNFRIQSQKVFDEDKIEKGLNSFDKT